MLSRDRLKTRIILAKAIGVNPDDDVEAVYKGVDGVFSVKYKGYTLVMGFARVPTHQEAKETIKNLYLAAMELEFDENTKNVT